MSITIQSSDSLVISHLSDSLKKTKSSSSSSSSSSDDKLSVNLDSVYKGLTVLASEVKQKIEEAMGSDAPSGGLESLNADDFTAEKTSDIIVSGTTALMDTYAKQHPELEGEELISSFMKTIRGGISSGYDQASSILDDAGAFNFSGVKDGIEETMSLVEEKLQAFEDQWRKDNLGTTDSESDTSNDTATVE